MKKRIIALVISFVLSLSFGNSLSVIAAYQPNDNVYYKEAASALVASLDTSKEIEDALAGVISSNVSQDVLDDIMVSSSDDSMDVSYTVKYLGNVTNTDNTEGNLYALTAATRTKTASSTEDYVDIWITMTWIDNFGTSNEIVSVSGGWAPNGRTLSNRSVFYGVANITGDFVDDKYEMKSPNVNSYYYTPSKSLVGFSLLAYSWADSAGYPYSLYCEVKSSIWD